MVGVIEECLFGLPEQDVPFGGGQAVRKEDAVRVIQPAKPYRVLDEHQNGLGSWS
jgi:hypothetical protein